IIVYVLIGGLLGAVVNAADHGSLDQNLELADASNRSDIYFVLASALILLLGIAAVRSEEHTSELQSRGHLVCRLLLEKKKHRHQAARTAPLRPDHRRPRRPR